MCDAQITARKERMMTLQKRVDAYLISFPNAPIGSISVIPTPDGLGKISGIWEIGNDFRGNGYDYHGNGYYGSFPGNFLKRVSSMFPINHNFLHLFSGSIQAGNYFRFDSIDNDNIFGYVQGDAEKLFETFRKNNNVPIKTILADPPYSKEDALKYGHKKLVSYKKVLGECHKLLEPEGWLLWLGTRVPIYANKNWRLSMVIGIYCGSNKIMRCLWGLQKR